MSQLLNIAILGAGESGVGAAVLAQQLGHQVWVSDRGTIGNDYLAVLEQYNIPYEQGQHSEARILEADLVIKSPGIPDTVPLIVQLDAQGTPIIDEIEWASRHTNATIIAITGSNGKTTTAKLTHHLLVSAGMDAGLAGNIGFSWAKQLALDPKPYYVLEVSSFQLDRIQAFCPTVAVLLNITPDHLDRYGYKLDQYIASKLRLIQNASITTPITFIYNSDDANIAQGRVAQDASDALSEHLIPLPVSMQALQQERSELPIPHTDWAFDQGTLALRGKHNAFNMQCAVLAAKTVGVDQAAIQKGLTSFVNEPHRLEPVLTLEGIPYINDSKATNVDAVYWALDAMTQPVVWIVGGVDKGNDYTPLFDLVREKVRAIVCLGKDNEKIKTAFQPIHEIIVETRSVSEAIKVSSLYAEPGDAVLLSPACASFDLFDNYQARGNAFKDILYQQHKILTEGISVTIQLNIPVNRAAAHQRDEECE